MRARRLAGRPSAIHVRVIDEPALAARPSADPAASHRIVLVQDGTAEIVRIQTGADERESALAWQFGQRRLAARLTAAAAVGRPAAWPVPRASRPPVSVVVPTKDRPAQLRRALVAARAAMSALDEILVVDNGRLGASRRTAEESGARYFHEPRPGVAFARNTGSSQARHETVVFLDDDGEADCGLIEALVAPLAADPAVVATVGGVLGRDPASAVGQLFDDRYPLFRGWTERRFVGGTGTRLSPFDVWKVGPGAAMAWRRSALTQLGGFDPALGEGTPAGGAEDSDLFRRALESGHTIVYTPHALLWHDHPATRSELRRKMNHYAVAGAGHASKITIETRRLGAAQLVARQLGWLPTWLSTEAGQRLRGQPALPLSGIAPFPIMTVLGMARFLRHRARLRALGHNARADGVS